jgi:hypothetical protein
MIEMLVFSIIPQAMRVETNSGQEKVEHFALSMLNHFKNRCKRQHRPVRKPQNSRECV